MPGQNVGNGVGMTLEEELQLAADHRARQTEERFHTYRFGRFIDDGFTAEQADQLEREGADYHVADVLRAASCPHALAMKILL
jgi:hypothetical protein